MTKQVELAEILSSVYTEIAGDESDIPLEMVLGYCTEAWRSHRLPPAQVSADNVGRLTPSGALRVVYLGDGITYWYSYVNREQRAAWCRRLIRELETNDCSRHTQKEKMADLIAQLILYVWEAQFG